MPFARQRLLAPAILLPWVVVALRSGIAIGYTLFVGKRRIRNGPLFIVNVKNLLKFLLLYRQYTMKMRGIAHLFRRLL